MKMSKIDLIDFKGASAPSFSKLLDKVQNILNKRFQGEKTRIVIYDDRISFACPYCGDSSNDEKKKRGNLYLDSLKYKCFNCGIYKNIKNLFLDFNSINENEFFEYESINKFEKKKVKYNLIDFDFLSKNLPSKNDIKNFYNFKDIETTNFKTYLNKRKIFQYENFVFDEFTKSIVILNLVNDKVLGFSKRTTGKFKKYYIYKFSKIKEDLKIEIDSDFEFLNNISTIFNIFNIDFNKKITIFEGAFDSIFINNSIAISGVNKILPIDIENKRYFLDNDTVGLKKSIELLSNGEEVFLWKKLLKDLNINEKIKDLNELIIKLPDEMYKKIEFDKYFSSKKIDLIYL
jgi:predicted RNA-binding Zn-ribbon protein involved in translation (DUF1610 family)